MGGKAKLFSEWRAGKSQKKARPGHQELARIIESAWDKKLTDQPLSGVAGYENSLAKVLLRLTDQLSEACLRRLSPLNGQVVF